MRRQDTIEDLEQDAEAVRKALGGLRVGNPIPGTWEHSRRRELEAMLRDLESRIEALGGSSRGERLAKLARPISTKDSEGLRAHAAQSAGGA